MSGQQVEGSQCAERTAVGRPPTAGSRSGGIDEIASALALLRLIASLLVVMAHSAIAYVATPLRTTTWLIYDCHSSPLLDCLVYWINGFVMPLFFLVAGVSAPSSCAARGPAEFVRHRARRLFTPFCFATVAVLTATYVVWGLGALMSDVCTMHELQRLKFSPALQSQLIGPFHLWFLQYLLLVSVLFGVAWKVSEIVGRRISKAGWRRRRLPERIMNSDARALWMSVPTALIFLADTDTFWRLGNSFVPDVSRLAHYAMFFFAGGWVAQLRSPREQLARQGVRDSLLAVALFACAMPLLRSHMAAPLQGAPRVTLAVLMAVFTWFTVFGLLGLSIRFFQQPPKFARYWLDASFWIYLIHPPLVGLMQLLLLDLPWPGHLKHAVVFAAAIALSLASYEYVVRYSWIGMLVNGARKRSSTLRGLRSELGWIAVAAAMVLVVAGSTWRFRGLVFSDNYAVVTPGTVFRCGRLTADQLEQHAAADGLRAVFYLSYPDSEERLRYRELGIDLYVLAWPDNEPPRPNQLAELIHVLRTCRRPLLLQGMHGNEGTSLAAAVTKLVDGASLSDAKAQFAFTFGDIATCEHGRWAAVLTDYEEWIADCGLPGGPGQVELWARAAYPERWKRRQLFIASSPILQRRSTPSGRQTPAYLADGQARMQR